MQAQNHIRDTSAKDSAIAEIRRILNAPKHCTFYDLRMSCAERGVVLRAAGLFDDEYHRSLKFGEWSERNQKKIMDAFKRISGWAKGLGVAV